MSRRARAPCAHLQETSQQDGAAAGLAKAGIAGICWSWIELRRVERVARVCRIFTEARRIGLAAVRRSREVDGVNTLHSMFPLAPAGLEWSDRGVNIHSQLSEASDRPCGGSEIVRGRGVNVHSMFPVAPEGLEWSRQGFLHHMVKVARQQAAARGDLRAHATAAFRALTSVRSLASSWAPSLADAASSRSRP